MFRVEPRSVALVVVDMQNDFFRDGAPLKVASAAGTIPPQLRLLDWFHENNRPVVFTRVVSGPEQTISWLWNPESAPPVCLCRLGFMRQYTDRPQPLDCSAIIDELPVSADDTVIIKYGYNAFHRTGLTAVLLNSGIDTIIVTGTVTQVCVEDTVRGGYGEGFKVALVTNAVSSYDAELHAASIRNLGAHWCRLVTSDEILAELAAGSGRANEAPHNSVGSSAEVRK